MENKTVEFSVMAYRMLLQEKLEKVSKALYELELVADEQNKEVINELLEKKIFTVVNNQYVASGFKMIPDNGVEYTEQENKSNYEAREVAANAFMKLGGKNTITIELNKLNDLQFEINNEDILKCVE